jgi:hypothetical protein
VRTALEQIARDFDAPSLTGDVALRLVCELGVIRALVDGLTAKTAKRIDDSCAYAQRGDRNAAQTVARALGVDTGEARRAIETAARLEEMPALDAAVRAGELSSREVQMIAETAAHNPAAEASLIERAADGLLPLKEACVAARAAVEDPAERSKRQHASRSFRMWNNVDGTVSGTFTVTPEVGGKIKAVVDAAVQRTFRKRRTGEVQEPHEAYAADALAEAFVGDGTAKGVRVNVHVVVDHGVLARGFVLEGERCEIPGVGPVSVEWVREVLGDAFVTAVIKKGVDITTVAHLGRHIPAELRTALTVAGRECDVEGCRHRGYLELDHCDVDFAKGGLTSWWNLTWLCYVHHRRKTAGARLGPPDPETRKRRFIDTPDSSAA